MATTRNKGPLTRSKAKDSSVKKQSSEGHSSLYKVKGKSSNKGKAYQRKQNVDKPMSESKSAVKGSRRKAQQSKQSRSKPLPALKSNVKIKSKGNVVTHKVKEKQERGVGSKTTRRGQLPADTKKKISNTENSKRVTLRHRKDEKAKLVRTAKNAKQNKKTKRRVSEKTAPKSGGRLSKKNKGAVNNLDEVITKPQNVLKEIDSKEQLFHAEEIISFPCTSPNAHAVCPISDDKAWIGLTFQNKIYLYNKRGEKEKEVTVPQRVDDITLRPDGSLLITAYGESQVWSLDKTFSKVKEAKEFSDGLHMCRGIHCSNTATFICYVDNLGFTGDKPSERFVVKLDDNGTVLRKYIKVKKNKNFQCLYRVSSNVNGDILLIIDHGIHTLIMLDKSGREKTRYSGQHRNSAIYSACCSPDGFIFVADNGARCVDVLYPDGSFCQTLVQLDMSQPNNISMDNIGHLWVGCVSSPEIRIFNVIRQ